MSESFERSAASASRYVAGDLVTPPPIPEASAFVAAVAEYSRTASIELIVPVFEEIFALAAMRDRLPDGTELYAAPFDVLAELHEKARFIALARRLGLRTPATVVATDPDQLREAAERLPRYVAKPAFSRAGTALVTNVGPRAGERPIEQAEPTDRSPWLVQEFVDGVDLATLAVARRGRIAAYAAYEEPLQADGGYSVRQEAVDPGPTLEVIAEVAGTLDFDGFLGLDYRLADDGPWLIECNPRCSPGAMLFEEPVLAEALVGALPAEPAVVNAGTRSQFDTGVAAISLKGVRSVPHVIHELGVAPGSYLDPRDPRADLAGWMRYHHESRLASREHLEIADVKLRDVCWNGEPLA